MNLDTIKDYIQSLQHKDIVRLSCIYFALFSCLVIFMLYRHFQNVHEMSIKFRSLNKARQEIQTILTDYESIKNKQNEVDQLLAKDKNFYLQKYYQDTIHGVYISNQTASNISSQTWPNGYIEDSLVVKLSLISMKQLCEFLQAIQSNPRVFVKNLEISKANVDKKINVSLSIATLKLVK